MKKLFISLKHRVLPIKCLFKVEHKKLCYKKVDDKSSNTDGSKNPVLLCVNGPINLFIVYEYDLTSVAFC